MERVTGPLVTTTFGLVLFSVIGASLSAEKHTNIVRLYTSVKFFEQYLENQSLTFKLPVTEWFTVGAWLKEAERCSTMNVHLWKRKTCQFYNVFV